MEECLVSAGINQTASLAVAVVIILIVLFLAARSRRMSQIYTLPILLIVFLTCAPATRTHAQAVTCDPAVKKVSAAAAAVATPAASNQATAADDGPYAASTSGALFIPFLANDSPGASTFDLSTVDLDITTPEIDNFVEPLNAQGDVTSNWTYNQQVNQIEFNPSPNLAIGESVTTPYRITTQDGITVTASMTVTLTEPLAQNDRVRRCNGIDEGPVTGNDGRDRDGNIVITVDPATVDLDPTTPFEDKTFTSAAGYLYTVDINGQVMTDNTTDSFDQITYTVKTTSGTLSNIAIIYSLVGACA